MDKTVSQLQLYQYFLGFFLPKGILDFFELVWMETQSLDSRESKKDILYTGKKADPAHPPPQMAYTRGEKLHGWYKTVNRCTIREVKSARDAIRSREDNVLNYFIARSTNASAESLNSKMKAFRAQLRGVSDLPFFMYRLSTVFG